MYDLTISLTRIMSLLVVTPGDSFSKIPGRSISVRCSSRGPLFSMRSTSRVKVGALVPCAEPWLMPIVSAAYIRQHLLYARNGLSRNINSLTVEARGRGAYISEDFSKCVARKSIHATAKLPHPLSMLWCAASIWMDGDDDARCGLATANNLGRKASAKRDGARKGEARQTFQQTGLAS
jgi:hypothetical protein